MTIDVFMPVLIREPWQYHLTNAAIQIMRSTTDVPFRMVVGEAADADGKHWCDPFEILGVNEHVAMPAGRGPLVDWNQGIGRCTAEFVVATGNDLIMRDGWLEAMVEPFEQIEDCGISCLASSEIGIPSVGGKILKRPVEGVHCPHMMFRRLWPDGTSKLLDEDYTEVDGLWADTDLVLRHYELGMRSYRNPAVMIDHIGHVTLNKDDAREEATARGRDLFIRKRHPSSGALKVFQYFVAGNVF